MKWWMSAGVALAVVGLGAWTYRDASAAPDLGRDLAEPGPEPDRLVLRLEGFSGADQEAAWVVPSGSGPIDGFGAEEPL